LDFDKIAAMARDVVVVGAGVIGCAVAFELARRGASVEVVDARPPGMGATQASAGVLAPFLEAQPGTPLFDLTARSLDLYDDFITHTSSASGIAIPYRRTGTIEIASTPAGLDRLRAIAAALDGLGIAHELLTAAEAHAEEPQAAHDLAGGLFIPSHGSVVASELTRALVMAARRHGAQIVDGGSVRRIAAQGSDLVVETDRGPLDADAVVLAAGSWSGQIDVEGARVRVPVRPVRGQLLQLAWGGPSLRRVTWGERCYLVPWADGTLLVGATVEEAGFDERTTVAGIRGLLEAAGALVPAVEAAGFVAARAGLRPGTPDDMPVIGPSSVLPNLVYATGHYRNGVLLAPITAQLVADALLANRRDEAFGAVGPQRFGEL
jgi:glycine oxidase